MAEIRHLINIRDFRENVYKAIATQSGLRSWWTADANVDEMAGGKADFGFFNRAVVFPMTIEELTPCSRVVWSNQSTDPDWNGTIITWELSDKDEQTILRFSHRGWPVENDHFLSSGTTWGMLMYHLKECVEGTKSGPYWTK